MHLGCRRFGCAHRLGWGLIRLFVMVLVMILDCHVRIPRILPVGGCGLIPGVELCNGWSILLMMILFPFLRSVILSVGTLMTIVASSLLLLMALSLLRLDASFRLGPFVEN